MSTALLLSIEALEKGPVRLSGVLPGSFLELENELSIRNVGELRYELLAELKGNEVLVTGEVEAPMDLECVRSGAFFSTLVKDSAFLRDYSTEDSADSLNLSEDVREAVVLQIPAYPVSPEAQAADFELPKLPSELTEEPNDTEKSPWNDLDQLNL
ncbi:MAG: YceD family protein [Kiritimatiellia bacterium]